MLSFILRASANNQMGSRRSTCQSLIKRKSDDFLETIDLLKEINLTEEKYLYFGTLWVSNSP
jgi:hypothetical protein